MINHLQLKGLTVVVGLGITGLDCIRYLAKQGYPLAVNDNRINPPALETFKREFPHIIYTIGQFDRDLLNKAEQIILSPGISLQQPEIAEQIARGIPVIGDIELFARLSKAPIIAITGSNGKTTVTTLIGKMIEAAGFKVGVGGNIGQPALSLLSDDMDYYVLELSSFQLETTFSLKTLAATILNISPDHMNRYNSFEDYCKAKHKIYQGCEHPIINLEQPLAWETINFPNKPITFSLNKSCDYGLGDYDHKKYLLHEGAPWIEITELPLHNPHHLENALAALALGGAIGLPKTAMLNVLRQFQGLEHRCQWVSNINDVDWYNDSKGTNIGATIAAILSLGLSKKGQLILIAGGDAKGADLNPLFEPITQYVDQLILLGQDAPSFHKLFCHHLPCWTVDTMSEAVAKASALTKSKDIVLLSPACASFDMFNNYEHRGQVFMECVRELA